MAQGQFGVEDIFIAQQELLEQILVQLKLIALHLATMTGDTISKDEV